MSEKKIILENVSKSYISGAEKIRVLRKIFLELAAGESIAVMGASGCGKSTLLNLVGGLDKMDSGRIDSYGYEVHRLGEKALTSYRARCVGFIFQFHYLLKDFTAEENVFLPAIMLGQSQKKASNAARILLEKVQVEHRAKHYPSQLSGGERQRVALARALINDPQIILADEPTGNLDEDHKKRVADLLFSLTEEMGKTLLLVTHSSALSLRAKRRLQLREGQLFSI